MKFEYIIEVTINGQTAYYEDRGLFSKKKEEARVIARTEVPDICESLPAAYVPKAIRVS